MYWLLSFLLRACRWLSLSPFSLLHMGIPTASGPDKSGKERQIKISHNLGMASKLKLFIYIIIYIISMHDTYLAGFLITLALNVPFASNSFFFQTKNIQKVAIIKTKNATLLFSLLHLSASPPFKFLLSFPLPSLVWCCRAYGAPKPGLLTPFYLKISSGWFSSRD